MVYFLTFSWKFGDFNEKIVPLHPVLKRLAYEYDIYIASFSAHLLAVLSAAQKEWGDSVGYS